MARHGWRDTGHAGTSGGLRAMQRWGWQLLLGLWLSIETANAGAGKPAELTISGMPSSCYGGPLNGVWAYQDDTRDGKGYYRRDGGPYGVVYLFFDKDQVPNIAMISREQLDH